VDVVHAAGLLSTIVGALSLTGLWFAWRRTKANAFSRMLVVGAIVLLALLANLVVREIVRSTPHTDTGSAPEIAGTRAVRPQ
jgi:hypothetical protein